MKVTPLNQFRELQLLRFFSCQIFCTGTARNRNRNSCFLFRSPPKTDPSVSSVASYITFALDSRGRLRISWSTNPIFELYLNASESPESNQKKVSSKLRIQVLGNYVTTTLSEDTVLALLCVVLLFFFCLLFEGQCQKEHLKSRAIKGTV